MEEFLKVVPEVVPGKETATDRGRRKCLIWRRERDSNPRRKFPPLLA